MSKKLLAEAFGTFWLVLAGCGSALLAAGFPDLGIGFLGVAFAFGLSVLTMAYAVGGISGGHFNPAVSVGMAIAGRFEWRSVTPYVIAQLLGACAAALVLFVIVSGKADFAGVGTFAANGYGAHSPGGYSLAAALVTELVMTGFFLFIILGATAPAGQPGFAPIAIGLTLTLIHLVSIPVTNTSVNPARSTAMALFSEPWALAQLWLFWVAPIAGAALGALCWKALMEAPAQPVASTTSVTAGKA